MMESPDFTKQEIARGKFDQYPYSGKGELIRLQGTRHSDKDAIIRQLETVIARLKAGDSSGQDHDDDFGYTFDYVAASSGPSFFDECPCNFS